VTPDALILRALRQSGEAGTSGAELARHLGISRAAVWSRIEELRGLGYDIEASPHLGYVLRRSPNRLLADDLLSRLPPRQVVGRSIQVFLETASTNDIVDKLARDGVGEGIVVFAERQLQGRGRLGRRWESPAGKGLWFSVLLRPAVPPSAATRLTVMAAVAMARAIRRGTRLNPEIKWPNDLLIRGRKCGGILLELGAELETIRHVILGIGLDVNIAPDEFPPAVRAVATSLSAELKETVDRPSLATVVLEELDRAYRQLTHGEFTGLANEWEEHCSTLGRRVSIRIGARELTGTAESLDEEGALLVRNEHGHLERIVGGDVTVLGIH
jgi:BirA family biotin operon repressor/biotin-[acetyl-CoA-carboxylase] ligase